MASITHALRQIKANLGDVLSEEHIAQVCCEIGHTWAARLLDPIVTIHVFILQVLHGNTAMTRLPAALVFNNCVCRGLTGSNLLDSG